MSGRVATTLLLGVLAACGSDDIGPGGGGSGLQLSTRTTGTSPDGDGYTIMVDSVAHGTIGPNDQVTVTDVESGPHSIELSQIQFNCATLGAFTRPVTLATGSGANVDYSVQCDDPSRSRISYSTDIVDGENLVVNADGSDPQSLTDLVGAVRKPNGQQPVTWSGDGKKMAFTRADGTLSISNADGTGVVQLSAAGTSPLWTHDGRKLTFLSYDTLPSCSYGNVYIAEPGVSDPVQVTHDLCVFNYDYASSGGIIAFEYTANGLVGTMHEDGTGFTQIMDPSIKALQQPSLSPDGSMVAYFAGAAEDNGLGYDVFVSPTDNSSPPVNLSHAPGFDFSPVWSPDGTRIAYVNSPDDFGRGSVYVVDVDGSHRTPLTPDDSAREPTWSPDGTRIAYTGWLPTGSGEFHIYVANADGSGRVDITPTTENAFRPTWTGR